MLKAISDATLAMDGFGNRRNLAMAALYIGVAAIVLYPVFAVQIPGLVDYPNHIARIHILGNLESDPALAANYQANWAVMPNLAMDALLFPFVGAIPAELLGRIFLGITMLTLLGGTMALSVSLHGKLGCWPALAGLLVYNQMLAWGFVNYLFGIGLYLWVFAAWIATRDMPAWRRASLFSVLAVLLFFTHLFALAVYGLSVVAWEAGRLWRAPAGERRSMLREQACAAAQFLLPALIVFGSMPEADRHSIEFGDAIGKLRAVLSPVMMYAELIDFIAFAFILAAILVGGRMKLHVPLRLPLLTLSIIALAMPYRIIGAWGAVSYADMRLPLIIAILLVAALPPGSISRRTGAVIFVAAAALLTWRTAETSARWDLLNRQISEYREALSVIERGAAVMPAQWLDQDTFGTDFQFEPSYFHLAAFAVIDRAAFVPPLFTDPKKQPVVSTPRRAAIDSSAGEPVSHRQMLLGADPEYVATTPRDRPQGSARYWLDWPDRFDYVAVVRFNDKNNPFPDLLQPVKSGSFFDIYKVVR